LQRTKFQQKRRTELPSQHAINVFANIAFSRLILSLKFLQRIKSLMLEPKYPRNTALKYSVRLVLFNLINFFLGNFSYKSRG